MTLNETHDPQLRSWVASANLDDSDFPIQNLPFGVFRAQADIAPCGGVAIGDQILSFGAAHRAGAFSPSDVGPLAARAAAAAAGSSLNEFMALGRESWSALRLALSRALREGATQRAMLQTCLVGQSRAQLLLPAQIGDYTDFYTSIYHATAVGKLMRPDNPLFPNYRWIPIGYHGRGSSIGVSGQRFHRPCGQTLPRGAAAPVIGASQRLDYELELGVFIGQGNESGTAIGIEDAEAHVFGLCLLNDWSARDLQGWEAQPLGPFLAKNFATTISPWIVTLEALEPFRSAWQRPALDPQPLPYLEGAHLRERGAIDIELEVLLQSERMRERSQPPTRVSGSNYRHAYWTLSQMVAHHSVNGCNLQPGDLLGTGTQSGPDPEQAGCLLELSQGGKRAVRLPNGEERRFLEDGDEIVLRAWCERAGARRIGFGAAVGRVLPAHER
ncbi:MAG TPA: fumarylacetoacetase [Steroidobacteraceae bacterium]|jgi:fumarylacetoacetase|nr:fumarylacetoacetase [Steroidobacteraceae bacterium]